jgi:putative Ca2+/H+ antiporter (TMEM165/GDT1 family)
MKTASQRENRPKRGWLNRLDWRLLLSVLGIVFISEMGDKTQITTLLLAGAKPGYVFWVALGSATALMCTSFLEVLIGSQIIARYMKPHVIKLVSALLFIVLGCLLLFGVIGNIGIDSVQVQG